jgi:SAM-dependent methyltransferase
MRREQTIAPDWFEDLFREQGDPWSFETSAYEAAKYDHTLASLSRERYDLALEVGCANGVLTQRLADRCAGLIAVDVSETALAAARARCVDHPQVRFERRQLPGDAPNEMFDLVVLSEVIYYWDRRDLAHAADYLRAHVRPGGEIMLIHWIGETDYPLSGDDAVEGLRSLLGGAVTVTLAERREQYRLDRWRRT